MPKLLDRPAQLPIHSVTGAFPPMIKLMRRETDHSSVEDKKEWICTSLPPSPPIRLHGLHRDDFVLCNKLEHKYVM